MSDHAEYVTIWGPGRDGRWALVRSQDDAGVAADMIWAASASQAWEHGAPAQDDDWVCSAQLAAAVGVDAARAGEPTDAQAMNLYDALHAAASEMKLMGMKYAEDAVVLLRAMARIRGMVEKITDGRSTPFKGYMETPDQAVEFYCVLSRSGEDVSIHITGSPDDVRRLYEVGLSGTADLDFNIIYAGFGAPDDLVCHAISDITGTAFVPEVFQYENGRTLGMTGGTARIMTALIMALAGFLTDGPGPRQATATRRGIYAVDLEIIEI